MLRSSVDVANTIWSILWDFASLASNNSIMGTPQMRFMTLSGNRVDPIRA
jgi:hypothetical protein